MMGQRIRVRQGLKADLPTLAEGELGFCEDTFELFVGTSGGNVLIIQATPTGNAPGIDVNANYAVQHTDLGTLMVNATPADRILTMPDISNPTYNGEKHTVKLRTGAFSAQVTPTGTDQIQDPASGLVGVTPVAVGPNESFTFEAFNGTWYVIF